MGSRMDAWLPKAGQALLRLAVAGHADEQEQDALRRASDFCQPIFVPGEGEEACHAACRLVAEGKADAIMKGALHTRELLKAVVDKQYGLHTGHKMSHLTLLDLPDRLIGITDGVMVIAPSLEEKREIASNAAQALRKLGIPRPKIALLCALETVHPRMPETQEADQLARQGLPDCELVGPLSYDVAMSAECARRKGINEPRSGAFDLLLVPNLVSGNLLIKALTVTMGVPMAGVVLGASIPIVLTSRSSGAEERLYSMALAAQLANR